MRRFDQRMVSRMKRAETIVANLKIPSAVVRGQPLCATAASQLHAESKQPGGIIARLFI